MVFLPDGYAISNVRAQRAAQSAVQNARRRGQEVRAQVERQNQARQHRNEKIVELLQVATQTQLDADPRKWWDWWQGYIDHHPAERALALQSGLAESLVHLPPSALYHRTLVWANTGRRPIEDVKVGDLVLAQNPATGELAYKAVLGISQSNTPTQRIDFDNTSILCAPGLALWRAEKRWWLARDVESECLVHGLFGPIAVKGNVQQPVVPTYHLAVSEFKNFFVGDQPVLVHDVTDPQPLAMRLPGLVADAKASD